MDNRERESRTVKDSNLAWHAMSWHGFGSPVGLGILLVSIGFCALLLRLTFYGLG
jgi:hypothetical protein